MKKFLLVMLLFFTFLQTNLFAAEIRSLGSWYDTAVMAEMEIKQTGEQFNMHYQFADGSSFTQQLLKKMSAGEVRYYVKGSKDKTYYVITKDDLKAFDRLGFIFSAAPMPTSTKR